MAATGQGNGKLAGTEAAVRARMAQRYLGAEAPLVMEFAGLARLGEEERVRVDAIARRLVMAARAGRRDYGGVDAFMSEYSLSSEEGVVLMCLAEALLRIPDGETQDKLIADKISGRAWAEHLGRSDSLFVNASTWGLMLTGRVVSVDSEQAGTSLLARLVRRSGEPVIRQAMRQAMRIMGRQFVLGQSIEDALATAREQEKRGFRHSYDMLGEAAMTEADAQRYLKSYASALKKVAAHARKHMKDADVFARPSISVKLSAIHPRYEEKKQQRVMSELLERLKGLCLLARAEGIALTVDAEEQDRLDISLDLLERLFEDADLADWDGLGLAVQAYGKRALTVIDWLAAVASRTGHKVPVRLVKGAYWDTEVKRAQEAGLPDFPVFTRKPSTDVSYLACARRLLSRRDVFYPQFATHNAHTVAAVHAMAGNAGGYEFQRLHGMGQAIYDAVVPADGLGVPCRIYAPVGGHEDLLAYLVRRLLENGANTSFVNRLADDEAPIGEIVRDPVEEAGEYGGAPHALIANPHALFRPERANSQGVLTTERTIRAPLLEAMRKAVARPLAAAALVDGKPVSGKGAPVTSPHDRGVTVGTVVNADRKVLDRAITSAQAAYIGWDRAGGAHRGALLDRCADLYEDHAPELLALLVAEAGKTIDNAVADLREAVDFLRYYGARAAEEFQSPQVLPGPTGERNVIRLNGRGVFACISPWNFPLAIFTGQVAAALGAGNAVIAKPAEQTPLVAFRAVQLMHEAGIPGAVLHLLPGDGEQVGAPLVADPRIAGVAFTGSNATANRIQRALAEKEGAIVPLIAETGGINAMIVDSTALPEQVVRDVVRSAFDSAGQRCSALRILCVQDDVAAKIVTMLKGAMAELANGDPWSYATDIGPVIDEEARGMLEAYKASARKRFRVIAENPLPEGADKGTFVAPAAYEISRIGDVEREVFGPVLHVLRYKASALDSLVDDINATGYGLTLGVHTRIEERAERICDRARVGNIYVNRNQIGAVVGVQPFGGEGLSGTGPKAGGPHYMHRFATERVVSVDTTASGGNAALMSLGSERGGKPQQ
ncbi:MAG: bifunctional proline dehydrogenase/L-glutamate gamma-semialdehyde dehydrogenase PutA [Rhodobiaceae bacterium]|nr:bifunctional proline dehydrogenase/L-glutamate gamma-semialdehyde dehydrogenase PutA [Rhodobiaceae bacterium]MCC0041786.1 bifunctional proline dehydrogenase/L-glutamate gamma-semialdehyde dehydrogenase PutA [Rhodobiaceae bacterium]